jgi:thiosulfate/3-mercaptopyruvate sulfurtransferase
MPAALPVAERGYANPGLLAETDWLAEHLNDPALRLIDTRSAELYAAGHIPGAVNLAAVGSIPRDSNGDMGTPEAFSELAQSLGINADSTVVVYDAPGAQMGMMAWALQYYGFERVQVLDGGFAKWTAEGRQTSTTPGSYPRGDFEARLVEELFCSVDHARTVHGSPNTVFWDVRRPGEFDGSEPGNNARAGHIAGAVHLEWTELLDPETRTFKPAAELRSLLSSRGITPESEIDCY